MTTEENLLIGRPQPRIDSFEVVVPDGPELTDEEKTWPVVLPIVRTDSFVLIEIVH